MGAFAGSGGKSKSSGGIIGGLKKIGGAAVEAIGAPQQVLFGLEAAIGDTLRGDLRSAGHGLTHALKETATLGQSKDNWDFAMAAGTTGADGKRVQGKLPAGFNTLMGIINDPLLFTGVGKAAEAGTGISKLAKIAGITEKEASAAVKAGKLAKGTALRGSLEAGLAGDIASESGKVKKLLAAGKTAEATAFTEKQAGKIAKMTARRGAGGLTAFIPGTEIAARDIGGLAARDISLKKGIIKGLESTKTGEKIVEGARQAFVPGAALAKELGDSTLATKVRDLANMRSTKAQAAVHDVMAELRNATHAVGRELTDADDLAILRAFEGGTADVAKLVTAQPELAPLAQTIGRIRDATTSGQIKAGVLDKVFDQDTYMRRILSPEAAEAAAGGSARAKTLLASEAAGGIEGALNQSAAKGRSIFPKMPVNEINNLKEAVDNGVPIRQLLNQPSFAKYVKGIDPAQLDVMAKDFEAIAKEIGHGSKFYQESALGSLIQRSASANRAIAGSEFIGDLSTLKAVSGEPLLITDAMKQAGAVVPTGYAPLELPFLGTVHVPPALGEELKKVVGVVGADDFVSNFDKAMQSWTKFWKAHATTGILGALPFATRNARSNVYLMMTEGMKPNQVAEYMKEAWNLETKVRKITGDARIGPKFVGEHAGAVASQGVDATLKANLTAHEYELWRAMQKHDIISSGFFHTDFADDLATKVNKVKGIDRTPRGGRVGQLTDDVLSGKGRLASRGRDLNTAAEHNARIALFMHNLDKYGDVERAVLQTKKVLFDYGDLTAFEQKRLKTYVPFYTFMRKNLPHQLETLIENPMRIALPEKLSQAQAGGVDGLADYQQEAGSRGVNPLIPIFGGAISTPDRPFQAAMDTLSPLTLAATGQGKEAARALFNVPGGPQVGAAKVVGELGTGKDFFTGGNVKPGQIEALRRAVGSQLPSLARLPRVEVGGVSPTRALTGKEAKPSADELLRLLLGIRVDRPRG